jgi:NAD(P)-dependent dehydrogenase (short-subunit alcohol dehydrogenase family)
MERPVAVVTGAGRGIGRGIALRLAQDGYAVAVLEVIESNAEAVAAEIRAAGGKAVGVAVDITNAKSVAAAVQRVQRELGDPAVLVHNAAVMPEGRLEATSEADWDRVYDVNVKGAYLCCRETVPLMLKRGGGSIVLMASLTGMMGFPALAAYSSTKGALIALARSMAIDCARQNIRVNSISPSAVDTPMLDNFCKAQSDPAATRNAFDEIQPRGRVGTIEEIANAVSFLASDKASFISGSNLVVDGAFSVRGDQPRF